MSRLEFRAIYQEDTLRRSLVTVDTCASTMESPQSEHRQAKLWTTMERLLSIQSTAMKAALDEASTSIAEAIDADKVDAFLREESTNTLVAMGTSITRMGERQYALGLDRLPIANGGRAADVFETGKPYWDGAVDQDVGELVGIRMGLGVRSQIIVPLKLDGVRRGVLSACSARPDAFSSDDLDFLQAVANWIGIIAHRAELVERLTREVADEARRLTAEQLITFLAHDLGNYLTPLLARTSLLRSRAEREGRAADLNDAESLVRSVNRLRRLIASLLDVSRLEHGVLDLVRVPVNLVELVRETAQLMRGPSINIEVEAPDELICEVDPDRLRQVLENLLSNAIKHGPPGKPIRLEVTREMSHAGPRAIIHVCDEGSGISPELQAHIFQRFVVGRQSKGLGVGLYLSRGITEAHGGTLSVTSVTGSRTIFRIELPMLEGTDDLGSRG